MGALLDHRPGVVTKGFCTLAHEQEQREQEVWQLDQPEEDEFSCDSFTGLSANMDLPRSTSSPAVCSNTNADVEDNGQSDISQGETCRAREGIQVKDGHVANMPLSFSRPSPSSSPLPSSSEMNGHADPKELQALRAAAMDRTPGEGPLSWSHCTASTIPCNHEDKGDGVKRRGWVGLAEGLGKVFTGHPTMWRPLQHDHPYVHTNAHPPVPAAVLVREAIEPHQNRVHVHFIFRSHLFLLQLLTPQLFFTAFCFTSTEHAHLSVSSDSFPLQHNLFDLMITTLNLLLS